MCQIVANRREGLVFIFPVLRKVRFSAGGGRHPVKNGGGYGLQPGLLRADHIDRYACRLSEFRDILRRHNAGIVGAIRKYHDYFSTRIQRRVFQGEQQTVVQCRLISRHRGTHRLQHLRSI